MKKKNLATLFALSLTVPMTLYAPIVKAAPNLVPNTGVESNEMQPPKVESSPESESIPQERPENPEQSVGNPDPGPSPDPVEPKPEPESPDPKTEQPKEASNDSGMSPVQKPKPEPKPSEPESEKPSEKGQSAVPPSESSKESAQSSKPSKQDGVMIAGGTDGDKGAGKGDENTPDQEASDEKAAETKGEAGKAPKTKDDKMVKTAVGVDQVSLLISLIGVTLTFGILLLRFAPAVFRRETA